MILPVSRWKWCWRDDTNQTGLVCICNFAVNGWAIPGNEPETVIAIDALKRSSEKQTDLLIGISMQCLKCLTDWISSLSTTQHCQDMLYCNNRGFCKGCSDLRQWWAVCFSLLIFKHAPMDNNHLLGICTCSIHTCKVWWGPAVNTAAGRDKCQLITLRYFYNRLLRISAWQRTIDFFLSWISPQRPLWLPASQHKKV